MTRAAELLTDVFGTLIDYEAVDPASMYEIFRSLGMSTLDAAVTVEYGMAYGRGWGDFVTSDVESVLGRGPRSFG